jgi:hypothetical protein
MRSTSQNMFAALENLYVNIHPSNGATAQIGPWPPLLGSVTIMFYGVRLLAS